MLPPAPPVPAPPPALPPDPACPETPALPAVLSAPAAPEAPEAPEAPAAPPWPPELAAPALPLAPAVFAAPALLESGPESELLHAASNNERPAGTTTKNCRDDFMGTSSTDVCQPLLAPEIDHLFFRGKTERLFPNPLITLKGDCPRPLASAPRYGRNELRRFITRGERAEVLMALRAAKNQAPGLGCRADGAHPAGAGGARQNLIAAQREAVQPLLTRAAADLAMHAHHDHRA